MLSPRTISTRLDTLYALENLLERHRRAVRDEDDATNTLLATEGPMGHQSCDHDRSEREDAVCDSQMTIAALVASLDFCQKRATADWVRTDMVIAAKAINTAKTRAAEKAAHIEIMQAATTQVHALATRNAALKTRLRHAQDTAFFRLVIATLLACGGDNWLVSTVLVTAAPQVLRHIWVGLCHRWWRLVYGRRG